MKASAPQLFLIDMGAVRRPACPMCGGRNWTLPPTLWALRPQDSTLWLELPLVAVICSGCGYTALMAARRLEVTT